ncbi:MAG: hypothetical protein CVU39_04160 [Chloroflexi bacterium HGW-Chloroflexi-10]|nr:MAG: hypothetical protein CVU39_04160 [Chloroflexi bacterium HGW-Chloroflexi-10]
MQRALLVALILFLSLACAVLPNASADQILETGFPTISNPILENSPVEINTPEIQPTMLPTQTEIPAEIPAIEASPVGDILNLEAEADEDTVLFGTQTILPILLPNFVYPELGCAWMGVAGQVFGKDGSPVEGLVVVVEGLINDQKVEGLGFTGLSPAYGPGGFEIQIANESIGGIFWIQVFDQSGNPITGVYSYVMPGTCEQNLAIINFTQGITEFQVFVPVITK